MIKYRLLLAAILAVVLVPDARAGIVTPPELQVGQQFRVVFVTTQMTYGYYGTPPHYDAIVQGEADAAGIGTYSGSPVTWQLLGSTEDYPARIAVLAVHRLPRDNVPIFLPDGTKVAASGNALWSTGDNPLLHPINETATGSLVNPAVRVWTGTTPGGGGGYANELGPWANYLTPYGYTDRTDSGWTDAGRDWAGASYVIYGFSSVLTVTPEPSTFIIWSLLGGVAIVVGWRSRKRAA